MTPAFVAGWAVLVTALGLGWQWDAAQLWIGARALLAGADPYEAVAGSGFPWPLYYPLPAVLLMVPFAWLPETGARLAWGAVIGAAFAYGCRGRPVLLGALSAAFLIAMLLGQLAPAMIGAAFVPGLGFLWAAKPSLGLALLLAYPSRLAFLGGLVLVSVSLVVMPVWPYHWLEALATLDRRPPVVMPGGVLLLLGWLRWRTPAGRLLGSLALVPHGGYDALAVYLVCKTTREALGLACLGMAGALVSAALFDWDYGDQLSHPGRFVVRFLAVYLPALYLVLRR